MQFLKHTYLRLIAETPAFFKKLRWYMVALGGLGASLLELKQHYLMEWLPAKYCHYLLIIGMVGTFLTSLPAKIPPDQTPTPPANDTH